MLYHKNYFWPFHCSPPCLLFKNKVYLATQWVITALLSECVSRDTPQIQTATFSCLLQGRPLQRSHQGRLSAHRRRHAEELPGPEGQTRPPALLKRPLISVLTTSTPTAADDEPAQAVGGAAGAGEGVQVVPQAGGSVQGLWAAEGLLHSAQRLHPATAAPPRPLQADPGAAVQTLSSHARGLQGLSRSGGSFFGI